MTATHDDLHGDLSRRLVLRADDMAWVQSPSGGVERKRFHRVGPPESGQVTSLVRYLPGACFPEHPHPEGEEILVLEGVFSDQRGDWGAGSWLANPEGFAHAPFSTDGCVLFVKLRQYPGARPQMGLDTAANDARWRPGSQVGEVLPLLVEARFPERITLERWPADSVLALFAPGGVEAFVVSGRIRVDDEVVDSYGFVRLPDAEPARVEVATDAVAWVKRGGVAALRAGRDS